MNERTLEDTLWEAVEKSNVTLKKLMDGVSKNVNPLKEIPNPQMWLYV